MTDRELRRLRRSDLLEMLIDTEKKKEALLEENKRLQTLIEDRKIQIQKAGSIAEAALVLNGVFAAAQDAAAQYLENVQRLSSEQESDELLAETRKKCLAMEENSRKLCQDMVAQARRQVGEEWEKLRIRLDKYYVAHPDLKELLDKSGVDIIADISEKAEGIHG